MQRALTFEEIKIGDELTPYTKKVIQEAMLRCHEAEAVPHGTTWVDSVDLAMKSPWHTTETMLPGVLEQAWLCEFMINWLGDAKLWLCGGKAEFKFIAPVLVNRTITYKGKVIDKVIEGKKRYVICDVFMENDEGSKCMVATTRAAF